jgi:hypothetical protein
MIGPFKGEHRWLSNFQYVIVQYEGVAYHTTEHAYQAAKTLDLDERELIRKAASPSEARKLGRYIHVRSDWDDIKMNIVKESLLS